MSASSPVASPPPALNGRSASTRSLADMPIRRLFAEETDDGDDETMAALPSVVELLDHVRQLQSAVLQLEPRNPADDDDTDSLDGLATPLDTSMRGRIASNSVHIELRRRQSSFATDLNTSFSSDTGPAPPRPMAGRAPPTRVAALTKENISLLRAPLDNRRTGTFAGSVCGSQKSRTSVRTDGGAVFSRLYQPDYHKTRDAKLKAIRDRQEKFNMSLIPKMTSRSSVCSIDSGTSSVGSMMSAKTDVLNVSSRLYDPEYMRKRAAKLQKMREERELRSCTFAPTINANASATRRMSSIGLQRK